MLHARDSMADNNGHIFCRCGDVYHPSKVGPKSSGQEDSRGELFFACPKRECGFFIWKREFDEWLRGGTTPRYFSSPTGSSTPKNDLESLERSIGSLERSIVCQRRIVNSVNSLVPCWRQSQKSEKVFPDLSSGENRRVWNGSEQSAAEPLSCSYRFSHPLEIYCKPEPSSGIPLFLRPPIK